MDSEQSPGRAGEIPTEPLSVGVGPTRDVVLLIGHGSRDPQGEDAFKAYARALQDTIGEPVYSACLEFNDPSVIEGLRLCASSGALRVTVVPLFLGAATHQKNDVPTAINRVRIEFPHITFV